MELILQNISMHVSLTQEEQLIFLSRTQTQQIKAKTILLNAGDICKNSYFVNSGVLRSFTINNHIVEHVLNFACEGWWMADLYSLISQKPGNLFIEAVSDCEIVMLSKKDQEELYLEIPKMERFFRILTENALVANQQRIMDNLSLPAEARFDKFCKRFPSLVMQVPQKQIASYIGVTPEFFSKMKANMLRKS